MQAANPEAGPFNFQDFWIGEEQLALIRQQLYHSSGPGYFIVKNFIDAEQVAHIRSVWSDPAAGNFFAPFQGKEHFVLGCPNMVSQSAGGSTFFNFLWSVPLDELTHTLTFYVQMLRSRLEGRVPFADLLPLAGKSVSYRVILNRNVDVVANFHTDYLYPENILDKLRHNLARLQATLMLSRYGEDYSGDGFIFHNNQGQRLVVGKDLAIDPGDLMLWRYNNRHAVLNIRSRDDQLGFLRIIYPPETIHAQAPPAVATVHTGLARKVRRKLGTALRGTLVGRILKKFAGEVGR